MDRTPLLWRALPRDPQRGFHKLDPAVEANGGTAGVSDPDAPLRIVFVGPEALERKGLPVLLARL